MRTQQVSEKAQQQMVELGGRTEKAPIWASSVDSDVFLANHPTRVITTDILCSTALAASGNRGTTPRAYIGPMSSANAFVSA